MAEATFYGLPFMDRPQSRGGLLDARRVAGHDLCVVVSRAARPAAGVGSVPFTFHPGFTPRTTASGSRYYEGDNGVSAVVGQPIVPSRPAAARPGEARTAS